MTVTWHITPLSTPTVIRSCSRCGCTREFTCSSKFRVNAQQRNIDVWLIYKCSACAATWNMTVLSRTSPQSISPALYGGFTENSDALAFQYAFDAALLRQNNVRVQYGDIPYCVKGESLPLDLLHREDITLHLRMPFNLHLRLDKLLKDQLGLSRTQAEKLIRQGSITSGDALLNPEKSKIIIKDDMTLRIFRDMTWLTGTPQEPSQQIER